MRIYVTNPYYDLDGDCVYFSIMGFKPFDEDCYYRDVEDDDMVSMLFESLQWKPYNIDNVVYDEDLDCDVHVIYEKGELIYEGPVD